MIKKCEGSCLCKSVTFELSGELKGFYLCHCSRCRKETGSAHAANLFCAGGTLRWISGEDLVKTYSVPTTRFSTAFCSKCGSSLPVGGTSSRMKIPAGCLDTAVELTPNAHIFYESRANWDNDLDKVARHAELPPR